MMQLQIMPPIRLTETEPPKANVAAPAPPIASASMLAEFVAATATSPPLLICESITQACTLDSISFKLIPAPIAAAPEPASPPETVLIPLAFKADTSTSFAAVTSDPVTSASTSD